MTQPPKHHLQLYLATALFALMSSVSAATIDFETLERDNAGRNKHGQFYMEEGFTLSSNSTNGFATWGNKNKYFTGSTALFNDSTEGWTTLTQDSGDPFSILSIDLAELEDDTNVSVTFTGSLASGDSVSQTFALNGIIAEAQTFLFSALFSDLLSLSWQQRSPGSHSFDNLVLNQTLSQEFIAPNAVPVPAAIWLFGSALVGLFGFNLRQKAVRA